MGATERTTPRLLLDQRVPLRDGIELSADIYLPFAVSYDAVEATYVNGLLRITLPREAATRISIGVNAGSSQ